MYVTASKTIESVVVEMEGTLIKEPDPFPYLMLVAFEASGPIRFALLLIFWPVMRLLELLGLGDVGLRLAVFIAVAGVRMSEIEYVGRTVLPKFYIEHVDMEAWRVFSQYGKRLVVSKSPRVMVEWFAKEHLGADNVIGSELVVNRFGRATGLLVSCHVEKVFGAEEPYLGLVRPDIDIRLGSTSFPPLSEDLSHPRVSACEIQTNQPLHTQLEHPVPVMFHDGRLAMFPKPATAFIILLWFPIGVIIAIIRMMFALVIPIRVITTIPRLEAFLYGILITVSGTPPKPVAKSESSSGVLFVCNHRSFMDSVMVVVALRRKITAVTYSVSRITEIIAPFRTVRICRNRHIDAKTIEDELKRSDTIIFPEGTTCREPFLMRFSALFAELTDQIVPVALKIHPTFFHPSTARGWKSFDPIFFFMNPIFFYDVTFLDRLSIKDTCSSGKSSYDVANNVQSLLATTLGFKCTNFTRKNKYMLLKGDDGRV